MTFTTPTNHDRHSWTIDNELDSNWASDASMDHYSTNVLPSDNEFDSDCVLPVEQSKQKSVILQFSTSNYANKNQQLFICLHITFKDIYIYITIYDYLPVYHIKTDHSM